MLLQLLGLLGAAVSSGRAPWAVGRAPASDCSCCCCLPLLLRSDDRDATIFLYYPVCRHLAPLNPHKVRPHLCWGVCRSIGRGQRWTVGVHLDRLWT